MKRCESFEPSQYSLTDKGHGKVLPSYDRMTVAVALTVAAMVFCAVFVSAYNTAHAVEKEYYSGGHSATAGGYEYSDRYGGFAVVGEPIKVLEFTEVVQRGEWATVCIQGEPNAQYDITVYLKSGPSGNASLIPKMSDEKGIVEWTWKIYKGTSCGKFKVVVKCMHGDNICMTYAEMHLTIVDR